MRLVVSFSDVGKRLLLGRKLRSTQLGETLLPKRIALPVFASDALSSVAYAPDEIFLTLSLAGLTAYAYSWKVAILVAIVMLVVVASYRQNVRAYPSGGGDYEVATVNLGPTAGLTVAAALLVDYVLTVAVSISSGVQNAKSVPILHFLDGHEGAAASIVVLVLMAINLRGVRESGAVFAVPTYFFMFGVLLMVLYGLFRILIMGEPLTAESAKYGIEPDPQYAAFTGFAMVALLARTFSSGCATLTGVEAISNGVPAFRKPKSKNAATTLLLLGSVAVTMMIGVVALGYLTKVRLVDYGHSFYTLNGERINVIEKTGIAQIADVVFDNFRPGFYFVMAATFVILFLAANTAFNGFPVLGSILDRDGYLPRQLHTRGDRLAYSNGIVVLAALAIVLILAFQADVTSLIQLYVVGVFVSFTVSQTGMLRHWTRHLQTETKPALRSRMKRSRVIIAIIAMAVLFLMMKAIRRHYRRVAEETALVQGEDRMLPSRVRAVVLVSKVHKPTLRALAFAKASRPSTLEALTVDVDPAETERIVKAWQAAGVDVPLKVVASPYREVTNPIIDYVKNIRTESPRDVVTVYIPEYVVGRWWEQILHNQSALRLKGRLLFTPGVLVTSVPYLLKSSGRAEQRLERETASDNARRSLRSG